MTVAFQGHYSRFVDMAPRLTRCFVGSHAAWRNLTVGGAWQRLNRFAAAIGYQTLSEAAEHLGVAQSTLVIQINRLERDIGGSLLERAERGRPMTPTALGEQVLAAFHRASQAAG